MIIVVWLIQTIYVILHILLQFAFFKRWLKQKKSNSVKAIKS